ncbi:MAG: hypothetical protein K4H23_01065 [Mollicutes bacterium PWAP]|nr:hypothetical protein [Mollicutes bacterium PWAP]
MEVKILITKFNTQKETHLIEEKFITKSADRNFYDLVNENKETINQVNYTGPSLSGLTAPDTLTNY